MAEYEDQCALFRALCKAIYSVVMEAAAYGHSYMHCSFLYDRTMSWQRNLNAKAAASADRAAIQAWVRELRLGEIPSILTQARVRECYVESPRMWQRSRVRADGALSIWTYSWGETCILVLSQKALCLCGMGMAAQRTGFEVFV